ncbi:hypothetical protein JL722_7057 [Aureococcus anophagefferens]|nr:hypothetical protein JL722_7057 [Aureococcus anophagefferens]
MLSAGSDNATTARALAGPLDAVASLPALTYVFAKSQRFNGTLPNFGSALRVLNLENNDVDALADDFGRNMSACETLSLAGNRLATLPESWAEADAVVMPELLVLSLAENALAMDVRDAAWRVPVRMHRFSRLMVFDLSGNLLTGDLDAAYDSKPPAETLRTAKLARNALTGSLPAPANLPEVITTLDLSDNDLEGAVWSEYANLENLYVVDEPSGRRCFPAVSTVEGHDVTIDDAYDGYDRCSCAKGYVLDRATGDCEGCAAGTYDAGRGCASCPNGTWSKPRAKSLDYCACLESHRAFDGGNCTACLAGTELSEDGDGVSECARCPVGTYSPGNGEGCSACYGETSYADERGLTACKTCPANSARALDPARRGRGPRRASMIWGTIGVIESDVVCADVGYECAEGYGNTLCERVSSPGYYKFGYYNPEACPDEPDMRKVFAAGVSAAFLVGYLVLHSFLETVPSINLIIYFLQLAGGSSCTATRLRPRGLRARFALEEAEKQPHISSGLNSLANWAWFYLLALAAASVGLLEDGGRGTVIVFQPDADWRTVYAALCYAGAGPLVAVAGGRAIKEHAKHQARNRNKHVLRRYARSSGTKRKSPAPEDAVAAGGTPGCGEDWLAALKYVAEVAADCSNVHLHGGGGKTEKAARDDIDDFFDLAEHMCHVVDDASPTSVYSGDHRATFWREFAQSFGGAIDFVVHFLTTVERQVFFSVLTRLQEHTCIANKASRSLHYAVAEEDRSSVLYYLLCTNPKDFGRCADFLKAMAAACRDRPPPGPIRAVLEGHVAALADPYDKAVIEADMARQTQHKEHHARRQSQTLLSEFEKFNTREMQMVEEGLDLIRGMELRGGRARGRSSSSENGGSPDRGRRNKPKVAPEKADLAASLGIDGDGAEENKAEDGDAEGAPVDEGGDAEGAPADEGGDAEGAPVDEDEVILEEGDASPVPRLLV